MTGEVIGSHRGIQVAIVIAIIATVIAAAAAEVGIQRTAPVRFPHARQIEFRIIDPIKVQMCIIDVVYHIGVIVEQRAALTARDQCEHRRS